jgi:hypothetical protein
MPPFGVGFLVTGAWPKVAAGRFRRIHCVPCRNEARKFAARAAELRWVRTPGRPLVPIVHGLPQTPGGPSGDPWDRSSGGCMGARRTRSQPGPRPQARRAAVGGTANGRSDVCRRGAGRGGRRGGHLGAGTPARVGSTWLRPRRVTRARGRAPAWASSAAPPPTGPPRRRPGHTHGPRAVCQPLRGLCGSAGSQGGRAGR